MAKSTPQVQANQLYLAPATTPSCCLDSSTWFTWLETATAFRYFSSQRLPVAHNYTRPIRPISIRKEKRRQGYLWYAYLRTNGRLHKRYLGKSTALTITRLDEVALVLNQIWE